MIVAVCGFHSPFPDRRRRYRPVRGAVRGMLTQEGTPLGELVLTAPDGSRTILDHGVQMHDCAAVTLFGRAGFLVVHRFAQVRFYYTGGCRRSTRSTRLRGKAGC